MKNSLLSHSLVIILFINLGGVADVSEASTPSFSKEILPLIKSKCSNLVTCHAAKGASTPFIDHTTISVKGKKIVKRITNINGIMPPIKSGIKLTREEIDQITSWVEAGTPNN